MSDAMEAIDTLELTLDPPVKVKGGEWTSLTLVEPRAQQVRLAEKLIDQQMSQASITAYEMELVRQVAKVPAPVVETLPVRKLGEAYNFLRSFIDSPFEGLPEDDDAPVDNTELAIEPPLSWNGGSFASLQLREPTAEELRKAQAFMRTGNTPYTIRCYEMELLTMVTGLNPAIIHGLRIRTLTEASRHLARFIAAGRKAGKA